MPKKSLQEKRAYAYRSTLLDLKGKASEYTKFIDEIEKLDCVIFIECSYIKRPDPKTIQALSQRCSNLENMANELKDPLAEKALHNFKQCYKQFFRKYLPKA